MDSFSDAVQETEDSFSFVKICFSWIVRWIIVMKMEISYSLSEWELGRKDVHFLTLKGRNKNSKDKGPCGWHIHKFIIYLSILVLFKINV